MRTDGADTTDGHLHILFSISFFLFSLKKQVRESPSAASVASACEPLLCMTIGGLYTEAYRRLSPISIS